MSSPAAPRARRLAPPLALHRRVLEDVDSTQPPAPPRPLAGLGGPGHLLRDDRPVRQRRPVQRRPGGGRVRPADWRASTAAATCRGSSTSSTTSRGWAPPPSGSRRRWPTCGGTRSSSSAATTATGPATSRRSTSTWARWTTYKAAVGGAARARHVPHPGRGAQPHGQLLPRYDPRPDDAGRPRRPASCSTPARCRPRSPTRRPSTRTTPPTRSSARRPSTTGRRPSPTTRTRARS